ncbi:DUF292-domain-containing protein [Pseudovirgaria hyperparasitica]|uniref:DUF292-domain-containing protein n=1 Tax=Pseudovirgaria hyperparasitica TaxID=470096 RepID=A0A6A6WEY6_9PEZI|nr:DUF292-domain-containing protein [Pseudovirgaria hyperparasitica]KAF2760147.1 DUF292-domain-containing protein [Pseudovirgaria hyperparasitica]
MPPSSSLINRLKVQLKMSISRLRMVQQKDTALAKQQRRALSQLVEQGKLESARIRVENIIRSDITTELHEILELYCELLLARSQLLDPPSTSTAPSSPSTYCDPGLEEPVRSLIYAAPRTEVKELHMARNILIEKFGKEFALSAMEGEGVAERVLKKLKVETPSRDLVDAYLGEICKAYGVPFGSDNTEDDGNESDGDGGGQRAKQESELGLEPALEAESGATNTSTSDKKGEEVDELKKAKAPKSLGPGSPLRIAPSSPSSENPTPRIRMPGQTGKEPVSAVKKTPTAAAKKKDDGPGGKIPDVDELAKRFAALKR